MTMVSVISDQEKISIITPFYNVEAFLNECIDSILNQTYTNWELLLVNDLSNDNSNEIAQHYSNKDPRIKLFQNRNKGLINALRLAYHHCKGNFLTRMDADDIMSPNKLKHMITELKSNGKGYVCIGKVKYFSESELGEGYLKYEGWLNNLTHSKNNFKEIYRECSIPSPNFLIYREDFDKIKAFENNIYPEDYDLAFRMYYHQLKVCSVDAITHYWRDHSNRSTRTQDHYQPLSFIPLKVRYFLQIDHDPSKKLVLWGAGKKGKLIAKELINRKIPFDWITDNIKKEGHNIYDVILKNSDSFSFDNSQIIIAVSNPEEFSKISHLLQNNDRVNYWSFF